VASASVSDSRAPPVSPLTSARPRIAAATGP
jgi:hypothetical protein